MALKLARRILRPKLKPKSQQKPKVGKKRELKQSVEFRAEGWKKDSWPNQGQRVRFKRINSKILRKDPINHLIKAGNKHPKLLILGPGAGHDIARLNIELKSNNINPQIDVLGLHKTINPELLSERIVKRDLSSGKALEQIAQEPKANKRLISKIKGRYDLVMAPSSVGLHTLYPAFNVFNASCMLRKGGVAYIEVPTKERITDFRKGHFGIPEKHRKRMINQLDRLPEVVSRFLESYGGKKYSQQFSFSDIVYLDSVTTPTGFQKDLENRYIRYIKVERK